MKKSEIEEKISESIYRLSKLEQRIAQLEEENSKLRERVEGNNNSIAQLEEENSKLRERVEGDNNSIAQLEEENSKLRECVEGDNNSIRALSDELYEYIRKEHQQAIQHTDNTEVDLGNRIHELSDGIYAYVDRMVLARDEALNKYKSQEWLTKFGYDNMVSDLQLNAIEQIVPGNRKQLEALKDTHVGETCFVIGNGPSLKAEDLDRLREKGVFCFASKGIYNIFEETEWRPDVWGVSDLDYIALKKDDLNQLKGYPKLVCAQSVLRRQIQIKDAIYYPFIQADRKPRFFNKDVTKGVHFYGSITIKLINFAVYMGFKEIYLLGCDNSVPVKIDENGHRMADLSQSHHFSDKYFNDSEEMNKAYENIADLLKEFEYINDSYKDIKYFCNQIGIQIFNATRGGALEIFTRKKLEDFLEGE